MPYFIARLYPAPAAPAPGGWVTTDRPLVLPLSAYLAVSVDKEGYATRLEAEAVVRRSAGQEKTVVLEADTTHHAQQLVRTLPLDQPVPETARLLQALAVRGVVVHHARRRRLFEGAQQVLDVADTADASRVLVPASLLLYETDDEQTASSRATDMHEQFARSLAAAPFPVRVPQWVYQRGRLIAWYAGNDERVIDAVREVLGPPLPHEP